MLERRFELVDGGEITLSVSPPQPDGRDFRCEFEVRFPDGIENGYAMGVDTVQALQLGLQGAHVRVLASPYGRAGAVRWLGQVDLGLPLPNSVTADDFLDEKRDG